MKEIFLAIFKETWHWTVIVTAFADALGAYADAQREKKNEVGFRFYMDLATAILKVRNEFKQREYDLQHPKGEK